MLKILKDPEATECIQSILLQADLLLLVKKKYCMIYL